VKRAGDLLPPDEQQRLASCPQEPIRTPGAVQPHGALLALDPVRLEVVQTSANIADFLGVPPRAMVGRSLGSVCGEQWVARLREALALGDDTSAALQLQAAGGTFDAVAHQADSVVIVELEPAPPEGAAEVLPWLQRASDVLSRARTVEQLWLDAARWVREITGFDRVMVYHFHPDGHGEVVAEERSQGMEPYLGLHYPASDIPAQARRLYAVQTTRLIVTSDHAPSMLIPPHSPRTGEPLDLSRSQLRNVSPHHLEFMRNMGVGASLSLSLLDNEDLVGMITANSKVSRHVPYPVRRACEVLARQISLQLNALRERTRLQRELEVQHVRSRLMVQMSTYDDVAAGLLKQDLTVLDLLAADGAAVRLDERLSVLGHVPPKAQLAALLERLTRGADDSPPLVTDSLITDRPDLAELVPTVAGVVVVPLGRGGDYVAWFRREIVQTVSWLGDQSPQNRPTPLSPRSSFSAWQQTVRGRALAWDEAGVRQAIELRKDIDKVLLGRAEARLAHLGMHDALTGLPNRRLLLDRLEKALARHARGAEIALLFIDLDRFKLVNDTFGHDVGDALLVQASQRIAAQTREVDTVARLGGDEFLVLCEDTGAHEAELLASRIVEAFAEPVLFGEHELPITVSIGLTVAKAHDHPADLVREADTAMYAAKALGRNRASLFEAGTQARRTRRLDDERALRIGIERGEMLLHYQPIFEVQTGALRGVEALVRWDRPGHGLVPPNDFVPLAEETGLIGALGEWVLQEALQQTAAWKRAGLVPDGFYTSVNVSPRQLLDAGFVPLVERLVSGNMLVPSDVVLEITETALMSEGSAMAEAVFALADFGTPLSIDDFGTGYSCLSYLRYLPMTQLKVDRSFVADMTGNPRDAALVAAVVALAHGFGMTCVAEGVEDAGQINHLRTLPCDLAQGFHLSRPGPAVAWTRAWEAARPAQE